MNKIRIAIVGVGNCASSLLQGINFYRDSSGNGADVGLMHRQIGPYQPQDIQVVAAFDIDRRKVGLDAAEAIFALPNCTQVYCEKIKPTGAIVMMGCVFDGYATHMRDYDANRTFLPLEKESTREQIIEELRKSGAEIMVNYLPVGSEEATRFYAACALEANLAFVNNIPVFIASDPVWAKRFADKNLPIVGDDIKAQMGATVLHRTIVDLFRKRGAQEESLPYLRNVFQDPFDVGQKSHIQHPVGFIEDEMLDVIKMDIPPLEEVDKACHKTVNYRPPA
jgi:myo-inositol-1-phosphate synthase